jgi:hypothetical protein
LTDRLGLAKAARGRAITATVSGTAQAECRLLSVSIEAARREPSGKDEESEPFTAASPSGK